MKSLKAHIDEAVNREYNIPAEDNFFKYEYTDNAQFLILLGVHNLYGFATEEEIKNYYNNDSVCEKILKLKKGEAFTESKHTYIRIK